tara:strand:- start:3122 stop:3964 length:843 start_codon:yes stop_codon:yes gene_type:complete
MNHFKIKSHAKVNLTLKVVGKSNSFHNIESIVSFLDLHDEIKIKKIKSKNHKIKFTGKFSNGIQPKNTISELLKDIDKKKLLKNKYQIIIKKNIPSMAGLGGGSMNAASILNFFIKKKIVKLKKKDVIEISNSIGSDVKLGLYSKNLILKPNNSIKTLPFKMKFYTLITKPNFGCSTKKIYSKLKKYNKFKFNSISENTLNFKSFKNMKNDLETVALSEYPKLRILKNFLQDLSNIEFVRMTGSGSAIIAYFSSFSKCREAEKKVKKKFGNYWCKTSKTI